MKRLIALLLGIVLMVSQGICVFAEENEDFSKLEIVETNQNFANTDQDGTAPTLLYIADILTYISKVSSNQVAIQGDVVCSTKVKIIKLTCILQKRSGTSG